jgi:hypothetical protein
MRVKPTLSVIIPSSPSHSIVPLGSTVKNDNETSDAMDSPLDPPPPVSNDCANLHSIGSHVPPLNDNNTDHTMIDHASLARNDLLATNLATYDTAHLLSDKIVVVFVQVIETMMTLTAFNEPQPNPYPYPYLYAPP